MLLTIGMIVKNEERYLRDCLKSIKPLLDKLDSELIIYDTGSTDTTIEIAKEFTTNVFTLEWRNDFAWARNHTIDKAKGKWYMWLDADEIYESVDGIIEFFNSGECERYHCATTVWKNLHNHSTSHTMFSPLKIVKLENDIRWHGKIHEALSPIFMPVKALKDVVALHYGYNYDTPEDRKAKSARNLTPLLERFEEDPTDSKNILQLVTDSAVAGLNQESKKYAGIGLELLKDNTSNAFYHVFVKYFSDSLIGEGKYEEAIKFIRNYFQNTEISYAIAEYIKRGEAHSLEKLKRYKEAAKVHAESLKWMSKGKHGKLNSYILSMYVAPVLTEETIIADIILNYAKAGEFEFALGWQKNYAENKKINIKSSDIFNVFVITAIKENNHEGLINLYDYAKNQAGEPEDYYNAIDAIERNIANPPKKAQVAAAFAFAPQYQAVDDDYIQLHRMRAGNLKQHVEYFLKQDKIFPQFFGDVVYSAIKNKLDFSSFLENLQITNTDELVIWLIRSNSSTGKFLLDFLMENPLKDASAKVLNLVSSLLLIVCSQSSGNLLAFEMYIRIRSRFTKLVYKKSMYCADMANNLPEQDGFTYFAEQAYVCKDKEDTAGFAENLRRAFQILPFMEDVFGGKQ